MTLAKMSVALVLSCGLALRARGRDHQRADPSLLRGTPRERERDALNRLEDLPCRRDARAADDEADRLELVGLRDEESVSACVSARRKGRGTTSAPSTGAWGSGLQGVRQCTLERPPRASHLDAAAREPHTTRRGERRERRRTLHGDRVAGLEAKDVLGEGAALVVLDEELELALGVGRRDGRVGADDGLALVVDALALLGRLAHERARDGQARRGAVREVEDEARGVAASGRRRGRARGRGRGGSVSRRSSGAAGT